MNKEYEKLTEQFTDNIFNNSEKQTTPAYVQQNKDQEQMLNMVAKVLLSYTIIDSVLSLGSNDKKALANKFNIAISNIAKGQFSGEKSLMDDILTTTAKDKYYTDAYITQIGIDFNLQKITDKEIVKVVNDSIDNKIWSDRLWDNKKDLENKLKKEVDSFLKGKTNVNQIEKSVKKRFNQNAYNTHRLVQTEVARCQNGANDIFAENHGVEYQLYTATLDTRTSDFCREHDGRTYKIDDISKPSLPAHPFCRSCYINLPNKDWRPSSRRDQENNKVVDWTTYQDWYDKNIDKIGENLNRSIDYKANWDIINGEEYKSKFNILGNSKVNSTVAKETRRAVKQNDGATTETMVLIDSKGNVIAKQRTGAHGGFVDLSSLEGLKENSIILTHNHPGSGTLSPEDIALLLDNPQIKVIVAGGHDGTVYKLSIGNGIRLGVDKNTGFSKIYREYNELKAKLGNNIDKVVEGLSKKYRWKYEVN